LARQDAGRLFRDILVPVSGSEEGWLALEQAAEIARREGGELLGLYVAADEAAEQSPDSSAIIARFQWRLGELGLPGRLVVVSGPIAASINERARWADLVVLHLAHPPEGGPFSKLVSGLRAVIGRCRRPVLIVPGAATEMRRLLLGYDQRPRSQSALYVATYLAGQWNTSLTVLNAEPDETESSATLDGARAYLESHGVAADCLATTSEAAQALLSEIEDGGHDLVILGTYSTGAVVSAVTGSVVDQLLNRCTIPMLFCP
jgi:nucleotide-binding universal stress UspA family protein